LRHGTDQPGPRHHDQEKADAFECTQHQQQVNRLRPALARAPDQPAEHARAADHGQARKHAAAQADRVRREADHDAEGHAGDLHQRQQKACFDQADAQRGLQGRDGRRQLAEMQGGGDARYDHGQCGDWNTRMRLAAAHSVHRRPVRRSCSRIAKRSVMPAI
jgi:hypothetical protein